MSVELAGSLCFGAMSVGKSLWMEQICLAVCWFISLAGVHMSSCGLYLTEGLFKDLALSVHAGESSIFLLNRIF